MKWGLTNESQYLPISGYGIVGNLRTAALVGRNGSVDWLPLPELACPSIFAAILDDKKGGRFKVSPVSNVPGRQEYIRGTNILKTVFHTPTGILSVTDFMPLEGNLSILESSRTWPALFRLVVCEDGYVETQIEWAPRPDYARMKPRLEKSMDDFFVVAGSEIFHLKGLLGPEVLQTDLGPIVSKQQLLKKGERLHLVTSRGQEERILMPDQLERHLIETTDAWRDWLHKESTADRDWAGTYRPLLARSELVLKLLSHGKTGAIAAAPTTSLPEEIGGVRNWDYRYAWIRDASFTARALVAVGHKREASDFLRWIEKSTLEGERRRKIQIMYDMFGGTDLEENELSHLEGYRGSAPVRVGNKAYEQVQLDVYGEILNSAFHLIKSGETVGKDITALLPLVADRACMQVDSPDLGIWEMRSEKKEFTYSKTMLWVALDRAVRLARAGIIQGNQEVWEREGIRLRERILTEGFSPGKRSFVQVLKGEALDASSLVLPAVGLIPYSSPKIQGTINATLRELCENGFVYRYKIEDGLPGKEGAFVFCTFWLVDALAHSGRIDEAWEIFEQVTSCASELGLLAEEVDPSSKDLLGNYPQAFSHIGLINSLIALAQAEGKKTPVKGLMDDAEKAA